MLYPIWLKYNSYYITYSMENEVHNYNKPKYTTTTLLHIINV